MDRVYIAAGSNKGDRVGNVMKALRCIQRSVTITRISSFIETLPAEGAYGGVFINGVIECKTCLPPERLFSLLQDTEEKLGRKHPHKKGDEREIDLDMIFYGDRVVRMKKLRIPHPRYRKRIFVLAPLCEIAPGFIDPETGRTVSDIYKELKT